MSLLQTLLSDATVNGPSEAAVSEIASSHAISGSGQNSAWGFVRDPPPD